MVLGENGKRSRRTRTQDARKGKKKVKKKLKKLVPQTDEEPPPPPYTEHESSKHTFGDLNKVLAQVFKARERGEDLTSVDEYIAKNIPRRLEQLPDLTEDELKDLKTHLQTHIDAFREEAQAGADDAPSKLNAAMLLEFLVQHARADSAVIKAIRRTEYGNELQAAEELLAGDEYILSDGERGTQRHTGGKQYLSVRVATGITEALSQASLFFFSSYWGMKFLHRIWAFAAGMDAFALDALETILWQCSESVFVMATIMGSISLFLTWAASDTKTATARILAFGPLALLIFWPMSFYLIHLETRRLHRFEFRITPVLRDSALGVGLWARHALYGGQNASQHLQWLFGEAAESAWLRRMHPTAIFESEYDHLAAFQPEKDNRYYYGWCTGEHDFIEEHTPAPAALLRFGSPR